MKYMITSTGFVSRDSAALGLVVRQGDADACREKGHRSWVHNGTDKGICARCGDVTKVAK